MMEENSNKQKSPARDAGGSISAPPEPGITIRTLESDVEDIERGGGEIVARQPVSFEKTKIEENINIPGYTGPEKAIFSSTGAISSGQEQQSEKKMNKWEITGIIIVISAIIVAFGFLGYFVISQWLFVK